MKYIYIIKITIYNLSHFRGRSKFHLRTLYFLNSKPKQVLTTLNKSVQICASLGEFKRFYASLSEFFTLWWKKNAN